MYLLSVLCIALVFHIGLSDGIPARYKRAPYCKKIADLAFIIDGSRSINETEFQRQIKFIRDIVSFLDIGEDKTRVAAVSFSDYVVRHFGFDDYRTKKGVVSAIKKIAHTKGGATRTYVALQYTREEIYKPGNGEREDVVDVVIVLTDGVTNPGGVDKFWTERGKQETQHQAALIKKKKGAYIFAIGVGAANLKELTGISSDPDEKFTILEKSFSDLDSDRIRGMIMDNTCPVPTTPAPTTPEPTTQPPTVQTTERPQKEEECKESVADIFFVLDESSSLKRIENFKKELDFVTGIIGNIGPIGQNKIQIGLMTFSTDATTQFYLNSFNDKLKMVEKVQTIPWRGGNTFLDLALNKVRTEAFKETKGARDGVPHLVVVITDGESTDPDSTNKEIKLMRKNFTMLAVGVGDKINENELLEIAGNNEKNVLKVDKLDELAVPSIRQRLLTRLCATSNYAPEGKYAAKKPVKKP